METLTNILNRRSVREYSEKPVSEETLHTLLEAAMSAPSCTNARDWAFITVTDRETLERMADANGRPAQLLRKAPAAVLVCGDLSKAFKPAPDYWIIDAAAATENLILAANDLGLGSVWLGTYPQMERVRKQAEIFGLPEHIVPHSIVALGYPVEAVNTERHSRYDASCVHSGKW